MASGPLEYLPTCRRGRIFASRPNTPDWSEWRPADRRHGEVLTCSLQVPTYETIQQLGDAGIGVAGPGWCGVNPGQRIGFADRLTDQELSVCDDSGATRKAGGLSVESCVQSGVDDSVCGTDAIGESHRLRDDSTSVALNLERLGEDKLAAIGGVGGVLEPASKKAFDRYGDG